VLAQFLDCVLPAPGGWYAAQLVSLDKKQRYKARSFKTIPELMNFMLEAGPHLHVLFCLATMKEQKTRKAHDVLAIRSFRVDIDLPYAEAVTRLYDGLDKLDFFEPTALVSSGGGLHAYWTLHCDLPYSSWLMLATGLNKRLLDAGVPMDPKVTKDAVRPPRAPGTWNHNYDPPRQVRLLEFSGNRYDPIEFAESIPQVPIELRIPKGRPSNDKNEDARIKQDIISDPVAILNHCAQLRYFAETGCSNEGDEPVWKACAGALKFCVNGEIIFHNWSRKDDRYNFDEAQAKLDDRRETSGGSLCSQFHGASLAAKARCEACPHWTKIKSPIVLGYPCPPIEKPAELPPRVEPPEAPSGAGDVPPERPVPLPTPNDFARDNSGSLLVKVGSGDKQTLSMVCHDPIYFIGRSVNPNGSYHDQLLHCPANAPEKQIDIPARLVASPTDLAKDLQEHGVALRNVPKFALWMVCSEEIYSASKKPPSMSFEQFGWNSKGFLWGDRLLTSAGTERPRIPPALGQRVKHFQPQGSLESWKGASQALLSENFPLQRLALLGSFAAPLMPIMSPDEGGAVLHFVSADSGTGKSTGLKVAASVWGNALGLQCTLADTKASTGIQWGMLGNLPPLFDELVMRKADEAENLLRLFTTGVDKARAARDGEGLRKASSWNTLMISAGNASLVHTVTAASRSSAMAERVLEFEVEMPPVSSMDLLRGQRMRNQVQANCGHAGLLYLQALVAQRAGLRESMETLEAVLREMYPQWGSNRRYWLRALSAMLLGGNLANSLGLIDFDPMGVVEHAANLLDTRHVAEGRKPDAEELLATYLDAHLVQTLVVEQFGGSIRVVEAPHGDLLIRKDLTGTCQISKVHFRNWLSSRDQNPDKVVQALRDRGSMASHDRRAYLGAGTQFTGGQVHVLELTLSASRTPASS